MNNYILFDDQSRENLLPLTFTRPVAGIRIGILTLQEKWEKRLQARVSFQTESYLSQKFPTLITTDNFFINGSIFPNAALITKINALQLGEYLIQNDILIAARTTEKAIALPIPSDITIVAYTDAIQKINHPWDIFSKNEEAIKEDFTFLTQGRTSQPISDTNRCLQHTDIFIEEGAKVEFAILNASTGPIYIGKDAEIMEGSSIRGPFALCEHALVKMNAKIYAGTTIGPYSKIGGEVQNAVIFGYSNKGHDGYLGNAVLGEWCNLGADTNNSNLKNNYAEVKLWSYPKQRFIPTGLQFCGLIMGDHSKCGINTMFNTGTVVGVSANIYGDGFQRNYIPSFSWGSPAAMTKFQLPKAIEVAQRVYERRGMFFDDIEQGIFAHLFAEMEK